MPDTAIRKLRQSLRLSQRELGERIGSTQQRVWRIEHGAEIRNGELFNLGLVFGIAWPKRCEDHPLAYWDKLRTGWYAR